MSTAFVLSGGASLGAVQVGMLRALAEQRIRPDLLIGTSAGALNAAFIAAHAFTADAVDDLAAIWVGLSSHRLFPVRPRRVMAAVAGRSAALFPRDGLAALVDAHLSFDRLEDAPVPVTLIATDFLSGEEVVMTTGDARSAILASCAIPAVFAPVQREGRSLVDGGLADNTALSQALDRRIDRIFVLPSGYACARPRPPTTALGAAVHAMTILLHQRLLLDIAAFAGPAELQVLPPPCPVTVLPSNFAHAAELIGAAHASATRALRDGPASAADIGFHRR